MLKNFAKYDFKKNNCCIDFRWGILTRTQNFQADYAYTQNFVNNTLFDGIVLIDISDNNKEREKFLRC